MRRLQPNRREFLQHAAGAAGVAASLGKGLTAAPLMGEGVTIPGQAGSASGAIAAPANAKPILGLMADAARVPEKFEYYQRLIDFSADWGLNALQFRLADDQGCSLRFESHPELLTHHNAFTPAEMLRL